MDKTIRHKTYGTITYSEGFWTGKKSISVNGVQLTKTAKNTFEKEENGTVVQFVVSGNQFKGVKLTISGVGTAQIIPPIAWYNYVLSAIIFVFLLVWGNTPALYSLFPIVGGAVGGGLAGIFTFVNLFTISKIKNVFLQIVVFILIFAASVGVCFGIGQLIIALM